METVDKAQLHEAIREWLRYVLAQTKMTATALANASGLAQTTINRFLRNKDVKYTFSVPSIVAVMRATGIVAPPSILIAAPSGSNIDVEILTHAIAEARRLVDQNLPIKDRDREEAVTAAEIYDVLVERLGAGETTEQILGTFGASYRHRHRTKRR